MFWQLYPKCCATVTKMMDSVQCVSSIAHHKHKISVTFSCIHKVQLFNVRIQTTKDSHKKKLQNTYSRGNDNMKHSP